ncbi:MAG TPA: CBS domain-containing protein [Hyphomicrobiaceae bacterium]|jgi:CBS domain-containing protein
MIISEVMTREVEVISPDASLREAARKMDELNVGVLPVCDGQRLVGMITDRDITVRATSIGESPDVTRVDEVMSEEVWWCYEDEDVEDVARRMGEKQIRRMPVIDHDHMLVGIVALGDLATDRAPGTQRALRKISEPSEPDLSGTLSDRRADPAHFALLEDVAEERPSRTDDVIAEDVFRGLDAAEEIDVAEIDIYVDHGVVSLNGTVDNYAAQELATKIAEGVEGVTRVDNNLRIRTDAGVLPDVRFKGLRTAK